MLNKKNSGFALIVAIFLMLITSLLALYLLEYIIPFSRNTKGMENGTKAYYQANMGIEDVLYNMKGKDPYFETGYLITASPIGYNYSLSSTGNTIPITLDGTSEFDKNFNKISISNPVQLLLKGTIDWDQINFYFKVPHFDETTATAIAFTGGTDPIINWQLSSENSSLNSSGSHIRFIDINSSSGALSKIIKFDSLRTGETLSGSELSLNQFYTDENCSVSGCTFKLSVVNELKTLDDRKIPYLEYKIDFGTNPNIANYYSIIRTSGKSTGYRKDLKLYIPQQTTIEAFDFTVFQ